MIDSTLSYKIRRGLEVYSRYYLKRETPVLIYCTGRVGSIAMFNALYNRGVFSFKIEDLDPDSSRQQRGTTHWVYQHIARPRRPAKVILIVRNPVALMVSDFLPKLKWITGDPDAHLHLAPTELVQIFNERYFAEERHTEKLNWFEEQPQRFLGIDVYAHPFDRKAGWTRFETPRYEVLVIRTEMDDRIKSEVVGDFVGVPDLEIKRINVGESNHYGKAYSAFKRELRIDPAHLNQIHNSRWGQHFYGDEQLEEMNAAWSS
jgi:hypothetical protein